MASVDVSAFSAGLETAAAKKVEKIADRIARLAEKKAASPLYSKGKTPGTSYEATVEHDGRFPIHVVLEANPENDLADMLLRIAIGGRKAYDIYPKRKKALAWPSDRPNSKSGKFVMWGGKPVHKPAIPPVLDGEFIERAMRNAIQEVANSYR